MGAWANDGGAGRGGAGPRSLVVVEKHGVARNLNSKIGVWWYPNGMRCYGYECWASDEINVSTLLLYFFFMAKL